ncbi:MAG: phosphate/phosphite/phosphonate ABC transporter substrate-binding protein [Candidatus Riflebacteria bacterium]|nr:phosphate/phosphite/phosphonate ABC transporter substrate-binding protein [Candidatus Riflebacteria bacterium]
MRWLFPALFGVLLVGALFLSLQGTTATLKMDLVLEQRPPIVLGVIPYLSPDDLKTEMNPILNYLAAKLNRPFHLNVAADYETLARMLEMRMVQVAWFSHASFEQLRGHRRWEVLVRPVQRGRASYFGRIISRRNGPIKTIEDLHGRTFAYVDRYSGSGFYFPNLMFKERGIDPLRFFSKVVFTRSHDASIDGVLNGTYDAAAVFAVNINPRYQEKVPQLEFLASVGPIPTDPMVVSDDLPAPVKDQIKAAMLAMHADPLGQEGIRELNVLRGTERFISEEEVIARLASESVEESAAHRQAETGIPAIFDASPLPASGPAVLPAPAATGSGTPPAPAPPGSAAPGPASPPAEPVAP